MMATFKTSKMTLAELRLVVQAADAAGLPDTAPVQGSNYAVWVTGEPKYQPLTSSPHSRACGFRPHDHGLACSRNCPTCHGGRDDNSGMYAPGTK